MDDNKIIELYLLRDEKAIEETKRYYGGKLKSLAFNILRNEEDANECENDTYLKTWNSIPPNMPMYFYAFISKICRHLSFGKLDYKNAKKRNFQVVALSDELISCIPAKFTEMEFGDESIGNILNCFLNTLSQDNRIIFMRRYWFMDSIKDISIRYKISESKVKISLHRTRKRLKAYLEREEINL